MSDQTVIKTYLHANGAPAARIVATRTDEDFGEKAGTYCHTNAHTVVVSAGYSVAESYYTDTQDALQDGPIMAAWKRYTDPYTGVDGREAAELTQRYARTYWPMVPVIERELQTGYSQGDYVTVLSWVEPANSEPAPNEAPYETATRNKAGIKGHHDIMEAVSRGQFWDVELQTPSFIFEGGYEDRNEYTVTAEWTEDDGPYLTLAMEEFNPWAELIEYAEESFDVPAHTTTDTTTYEL